MDIWIKADNMDMDKTEDNKIKTPLCSTRTLNNCLLAPNLAPNHVQDSEVHHPSGKTNEGVDSTVREEEKKEKICPKQAKRIQAKLDVFLESKEISKMHKNDSNNPEDRTSERMKQFMNTQNEAVLDRLQNIPHVLAKQRRNDIFSRKRGLSSKRSPDKEMEDEYSCQNEEDSNLQEKEE
jgi:hypothetical protein